MNHRIAIIANPQAGNHDSAERLRALVQQLNARGAATEILPSSSAEHTSALSAVAALNHDVVVAIGGDGMVRDVAAGLVAASAEGSTKVAALAISPAGHGNDFAARLGIRRTISAHQAASIILEGQRKRIDVLEAGGRIVVGNVSLGLDTKVHHYAKTTKIFRGKSVYAYGAVRAVFGWKPLQAQIETGDEVIETGAHTVVVANSGWYGGGMQIAPDAELDDGQANLVVLGDMPLFTLATKLPALMTGKKISHPKVHQSLAREVRIHTSDIFDVFADGDSIGQTPMSVKVLPKALAVMTP